jgi:hypothetical protein
MGKIIAFPTRIQGFNRGELIEHIITQIGNNNFPMSGTIYDADFYLWGRDGITITTADGESGHMESDEVLAVINSRKAKIMSKAHFNKVITA